jgi:heptosyltransferase-2
MSRPQGRILVIRGGAIGDFLLTLPVLAALRAQFPQAWLEVLGYPHIAQLAHANGLADAVRSIDARPLAGFFAQGASLDPELARYFGEFAVIVSFLYDPDEVFKSNVARCSRAQFIVGPHRPDEKLKEHATEVYLRPLERLAIFGADPVPQLRQPPRPPAEAPPTLAVHPGSGSERKNWPEAKWVELLGCVVRATEHRLLLVGGEAEGGRLERLAAGLPRERGEMFRNRPLIELAQRLGGCAGFIGHDSGISHLAAAVGLPVLVLWGDTEEAIWRPLGNNVRLLRHPTGLAALPVSTVFEAVRRHWLDAAVSASQGAGVAE